MELLSFGATGWGDELAGGLWLTVRLAVVSLLFGLAFGLLGAAAKLSGSAVLRAAGEVYTTLIRGIPELLIIFLVFFGSGRLLQTAAGLFGYDGYIEVSAFAAGVFALSLVFGGFATEVFRGAFLAVPKGQIEAARAIGMSRWLVLRRIRLPQVWRHALPGLGNLWLVLIKDTALVSVIALDELIRMTNVAIGSTKQPFTFYMAACLIYLALTVVSMGGLARLERWASRGVRRR